MKTESEVKTAEQFFNDESHRQWIASSSFSGGFNSLTRIPYVVQPAVFKVMEEYAQSQTQQLREKLATCERADRIDSNSFEERCSEASHYTWLDDRNNELEEENTRLREVLKNLLKYIDDGFLIRDTSKDSEHGWTIKMLPFVKDLKEAYNLINPK